MSVNNQSQSACIFPTEPIFGSIPTSISFSGGTSNGPGFERKYTLRVPAGNIYSVTVRADDFARVSGAGISAESYWDAKNKRIVPGSATSEYTEITGNAEDVLFSVEYRNNGGPYVLFATVTSIRSGVASAGNSSYFIDTSCRLQYSYSLQESFIASLISQFLVQQGISTPVVLPWMPTGENSEGWSGNEIPPAVIYAEGELSVKAGVSVNPTSEAATFEVDIFRGGASSDFSVGIQIDTNGNAAASVRFNF